MVYIPLEMDLMAYRESFAKQRAVQMYLLNHNQDLVEEMLRQEGAGEQASALALLYYRDYLFIKNKQSKAKIKNAKMELVIGITLITASLAYSVLTYFILENDNYLVFIGLLIIGAILTIRGLIDRQLKNSPLT